MNHSTILLIATVLLAAAGCSNESGPTRVAVAGTVTLDGKPIEDATIRFVPLEEGHDALATITRGEFTLDQESGPTEGKHRVMILPNEPELAQAIAMMQQGDRDPLRSKVIPRQYQTKSELTETVSADSPNRLRLELTSR